MEDNCHSSILVRAWSGFDRGASVILTEDQYQRYKAWLVNGSLIQDALPDLGRDQREILMTGIGPEDFSKL